MKGVPKAPAAKPCCVPRWKWRKIMHLNLPVEANNFVKSLVAQGKYQTEEAAVVDGIRLLMGREKLRSEINKGVEQLDRNEAFDEEAVFAELESEINKIESSQQEG
jgi:antitoxin ParD1/3/4